jgi:2-aminoadipate transaminase
MVSTPLSQRARWAGNSPISHLMHMALARPELISLAAGFVDPATLPVESAQSAIDAVLSKSASGRASLQYGTTAGLPELQEGVLARLLKADQSTANELNLSVDQVVLTAGSNQLLHLIGETLLDPGDIVLCAAPTYFVFLGMLANQGARSVGVGSDGEGIIPDALDEELRRCEQRGELERVKAIYVVSYFDNPSNVTLSALRRGQIVEIAKRWSKRQRIYVIEDAAYRELRYAGDDLPSLRSFDPEGETVIVAETFSKSFSPGIRVGWGILPKALVEPVCNQKGNIDFGAPNFNQHVMANVLRQELFEPHAERLRAAYREKLAAMLAAADQHLAKIPGVAWQRPTGGLYIWLTLPENVDAGPESALLRQALDAGVLYVPGEYCYPSEGQPIRRIMIRLSFGVQSPENISRGIAALARAIAAVVNR